MRIFNRVGVKPHILPTAVDDPTVISMVEHGLGVSMMTELTLRGRGDGVLLVPVEAQVGAASSVWLCAQARDGRRRSSSSLNARRQCSPSWNPNEKGLGNAAQKRVK